MFRYVLPGVAMLVLGAALVPIAANTGNRPGRLGQRSRRYGTLG